MGFNGIPWDLMGFQRQQSAIIRQSWGCHGDVMWYSKIQWLRYIVNDDSSTIHGLELFLLENTVLNVIILGYAAMPMFGHTHFAMCFFIYRPKRTRRQGKTKDYATCPSKYLLRVS